MTPRGRPEESIDRSVAVGHVRGGVRSGRRARAFWATAAAVSVAAAACNSESPFQVIEDLTFFSGLGIDLNAMTKLPSGVYIQDDSVGTGALLAAGDTARLDHLGWLADGTTFSSGQFAIVYRQTSLVEGFNIGLEGMAVGGRRLMIIPPELGYGSNPPRNSPIPKGAVLVFEVKLLDAY